MNLFDILFLISWLVVPVIWFLVLRLAGIHLLKLSLPSFVVFSILFFNYIGFPILYFDLDAGRIEYISNKYILLNVWLITSFTTFLMTVGSYIGALTLGPLRFFKNHDIVPIYCPSHIISRSKVVGVFCLSILYLYVQNIGFSNLAVVVALNGSSLQDTSLARSLMGNDFGGRYHWYNVFMRDVLMLISLILFATRWLNSRPTSLFVIFIITVSTIFSLVMATEKGWLANYFLLLTTLYLVVKKGGSISLSVVTTFLMPLFVILVIFYVLFMHDSSIGAAVISVFSRALTGSLQPAYHYLEFFPIHHDWLYGSSFPNPGGLLPFVPYSLAVELMNFVNPEHLTNNIVGTMPAIYWGEVYANFGYLGLILIPPLIGFALYFLNWFVFKFQYNPLNISFFCFLLVHYKELSVTSFSAFAFDFNLYVVILVFIMIRIRLFK